MSRVVAALIAVLLAASPAAGMVVGPGGHGSACCPPSVGHCEDPTPRLRCCEPRGQTDPAAQPPTVAAPASGRDAPTAEVAAPPVPPPLVAVIASRAFTTRQRLAIHAPPHLRLCVFLI